jgi:cytochrome c oxidase assembly factor CtaG
MCFHFLTFFQSLCYMHSNSLYDCCTISTAHATCSSLEPTAQLSLAYFTLHFAETVLLTVDVNKFLVIQLPLPCSLHSIPSCTAVPVCSSHSVHSVKSNFQTTLNDPLTFLALSFCESLAMHFWPILEHLQRYINTTNTGCTLMCCR